MSDGYVDRSEILAEAYPGAANDIARAVEQGGGWICEQHPDQPFPHGDCAGPGMLRSEYEAYRQTLAGQRDALNAAWRDLKRAMTKTVYDALPERVQAKVGDVDELLARIR